jgi:hypothetical protein
LVEASPARGQKNVRASMIWVAVMDTVPVVSVQYTESSLTKRTSRSLNIWTSIHRKWLSSFAQLNRQWVSSLIKAENVGVGPTVLTYGSSRVSCFFVTNQDQDQARSICDCLILDGYYQKIPFWPTLYQDRTTYVRTVPFEVWSCFTTNIDYTYCIT